MLSSPRLGALVAHRDEGECAILGVAGIISGLYLASEMIDLDNHRVVARVSATRLFARINLSHGKTRRAVEFRVKGYDIQTLTIVFDAPAVAAAVFVTGRADGAPKKSFCHSFLPPWRDSQIRVCNYG